MATDSDSVAEAAKIGGKAVSGAFFHAALCITRESGDK
jgi:hypothetical protein